MGKQCCSDKTCCESNRPATPYSSRTTPPPGLCIAVVSEDEESLVVFDAAGTPRRYHHRKGLNLRKLCFHVHSGTAKNDDDAMLSPCFDENGLHGEPDETCFCGVEDPHIHAHLREECRGLEPSKHNKIPFARSVSQTLYPSDTICGKSFLHVSASANMPNECHSLPKDQIAQVHTRVHQIQHGDHMDSLVRNETTGLLHLQHEDCGKCDGIDIHGTFDNIGIRNLPTADSEKELQIHFFAISQKKFNILDHFAHFFELRGDPRVQAAVSTSQSHEETTVRSTIVCNGICCASEVPLVRKLVDPLPGVRQVKVNVPLKQVIVDHNPDEQTATQLVQQLSSLGSTLLRDGAERPAKLLVTSLLSIVPKPDENGVVDQAPMMDAILQRFPPHSMEGTLKEEGNSLLLSVTYNPLTYTAQQIGEVLVPLFDSEVQQDGANLWLSKTNQDTAVSSSSSTSSPTFPRPTVVLSGILWLVSMASSVREGWYALPCTLPRHVQDHSLTCASCIPQGLFEVVRTRRSRFRLTFYCPQGNAFLAPLPVRYQQSHLFR